MISMDSRDTTPPPFRPTPEGRQADADDVNPWSLRLNRRRVMTLIQTGVYTWPRP